MKILLDTHAFLWWITDDPRLSDLARKLISQTKNQLFLSAASGWEIVIKAKLGRLKLTKEPHRFVLEQMRINAVSELPIQMAHALQVFTLPDFHRDPFDRMIVAQARFEKMPVLSADPEIRKYQVEVIWD